MKTLSTTIVLALVAFAPRVASADPLSLRAPSIGRSVDVVGGVPGVSAGGWITDHFGVAIEGTIASAIGGDVGTRAVVLGRDRGPALEVFASAGLLALRYQPGMALTMTPAMHFRVRGDRLHFATGIASPMAFEVVGQRGSRIPLVYEAWFGVRVSRVWFGVQGGAGLVWADALSPSLGYQASGFVTVALDGDGRL